MPPPSDVLGDKGDEGSIRSPSGGENQHPPQKLPWDVISHIGKRADWPTLKAISLVCRDFRTESAPTLCRRVTISVKHSTTWGEGLPALQAQTEVLKNHTP